MAEGGRGRGRGRRGGGGGGERLLQRERGEVGEGEKKGEIGGVEEMTVSLCFHVLTTLTRAALNACPEVCMYLTHEVYNKKEKSEKVQFYASCVVCARSWEDTCRWL